MWKRDLLPAVVLLKSNYLSTAWSFLICDADLERWCQSLEAYELKNTGQSVVYVNIFIYHHKNSFIESTHFDDTVYLLS